MVAPSERSIWIGYDPREDDAFAVAHLSMRHKMQTPIPISGISLRNVRRQGLYKRQSELRVNSFGHQQLWDSRSAWWMSTEFAISRFLVPFLAGKHGWALFTDCDVLARQDINLIFNMADSSKAIQVVQHEHAAEGVKMDGQVQTAYGRKNWSSVMLWNLAHPAHMRLTLDHINTMPGRWLHQFSWLADEEIGALPYGCNYLVNHNTPEQDPDPLLVHFTDGIPSMDGHDKDPYAEEWFWYGLRAERAEPWPLA